MADTVKSRIRKTIVVPQELESFFSERLSRIYAGKTDVAIVVNKRSGERRSTDHYICSPSPLANRRASDRRDSSASWSLPRMPFAAS